MHLRLFLVMIFTAGGLSAQINFEKGYIIDTNGKRTECLIKNEDWRDNPVTFKYKLDETSPVIEGEYQTVTEFGISDLFKFRRFVVKLDLASDLLSDLGTLPGLNLTEKTLYLKQLVDGKAALYFYESGTNRRFFYTPDSGEIRLLEHKEYIDGTKIRENARYKQELLNALRCEKISESEIQHLEYSKTALMKIFKKYNSCFASETLKYEERTSAIDFNLRVKAGANLMTMDISNEYSRQYGVPYKVDFGSKTSFTFGLEAELVLPINKNKWAVFTEPTYQNYSQKTETPSGLATIDYKALELPLGLRHYLFLNDRSKIFIDAAFVMAFNLGSTVVLPADYFTYNLNISGRSNFNLGIGYEYHNKYSIAARLKTKRSIFGGLSDWESNFNGFSVVLGYNFL